MVDWLFWLIAGLVAVAGLGLALRRCGAAPRRAERRASYDIQVLRDQLRGVEADLDRGVLSPAEAAASRTELSRRLLAAAEVEAAEGPAATAPRRVSQAPAAVGPGWGSAPRPGSTSRSARRSAGPAAGGAGSPLPRGTADQAAAEALARGGRRRRRPAGRGADRAAAQGPRRSSDEVEAGGCSPAASPRPGGGPRHARLRPSGAPAREAAGAQDHVDLAELGIMAAGGYVAPSRRRRSPRR